MKMRLALWGLATLLAASVVSTAACGSSKKCAAGQADCGGACADLQTDPANCGACASACPQGASCQAGACKCPGTAPDACAPVGGRVTVCVDKATDAANCGSCNHACGLGTCAASACTCNGGATRCPGASPECVDTSVDVKNCGACGFACGLGTCGSGTCNCNPGAASCGGTCCEGTGCCSAGATCQTKHSNGLGQFFFDCNPPGTFTLATATAAATAWYATGSDVPNRPCGASTCFSRAIAGQCAVWCYSGPDAGKVVLDAASSTCYCPGAGGSQYNWN